MSFTGNTTSDAKILSFLQNKDLKYILQTNKYFRSFNEFAVLWQDKIKQEFGLGHIQRYKNSDWKPIRPISITTPNSTWCQQKKFLLENNFKIHYGDIVQVNQTFFIYDGQKSIEIDRHINKTAISSCGRSPPGEVSPQSFHMLSDNKRT